MKFYLVLRNALLPFGDLETKWERVIPIPSPSVRRQDCHMTTQWLSLYRGSPLCRHRTPWPFQTLHIFDLLYERSVPPGTWWDEPRGSFELYSSRDFSGSWEAVLHGLKESIVTRFLTHIVLEMGEAFLLNPRRLHREGEKKLVEWEAQCRGGAGREAHFYKLTIVCTYVQYRVKGSRGKLEWW